ncbi:glycosyltransferase [Terrimonas rubra]|uniref:Glycosyltransferase n=1 Tax=Terrimonas rubra TaxID=1035890 RepID=A0ABW6A8N7_9BACT
MNVVIIGPGHPLRGGLATFNHRLAKAFQDEGHTCSIYSFSLQYPSFLFPGKSQYSTDPAPEGITIHTVINSINPLNWIKVGNRLKKEKPDLIVVRYWLPLMGPALGTILRRAKKNGHTRVVCIADNIIPHEKRPGDKPFTRYFLKACDAVVTMSEKVMADLRLFDTAKPAALVRHPLYDNFGSIISSAEAREHLQISNPGKLLLFFGFIRQYKGLDMLLEAVAILKKRNSPVLPFKLLIAGEFYEDAERYHSLIKDLDIADLLILKTDFIADSEVKYYLCAADVLIQPYRNATQSGVTPLAYHFETPMVVTNVGSLATLVPHGKVGIVTTPDAAAIADGIEAYFKQGKDFFIPHIQEEKKQYSWDKLVNALVQL